MKDQYDFIVIGGGAAGLAAAIYAGRARRDTLVLERGEYGGRVKDTAEISNYPGIPTETGVGLMERFRAHASAYPQVEWMRSTVTSLRKEGDLFFVGTKRRGELAARSVLLALGTRPRELGIPGEKEFAGHGVAYCATCDADFFRGKQVYVLGAGDQAVEESDYLTRFAAHVTIIVLHPEGHLDCNKIAAQRAYQNPKISFLWNTTVAAVQGGDSVNSLLIKNVETGEAQNVPADGLFFFVGAAPQTGFVRDLVECDRNGYIRVNEKMETSLPGLYAAGDCTQCFLRQVVTSAAQGAVAATASERYVEERETLRGLLGPDSGNVAFLFYNPYQSEELDCVTGLEKALGGAWTLYRQDVTRQDVLYRELGCPATVSAAYYHNGTLLGVRTAQEEPPQKGEM